MFVQYPRRLKALNFHNFDNSHNSFLWPFLWFFMWKMDPMSGFAIRLVFTLPPRDSTLQYKICLHLWKNFPCIITLMYTVWYIYSIHCIHCTNTRIGWYPAIRSKSSQGKSTKTLTWKTLRTLPSVALGTDYRLFQPSRFRSRNIIYQTTPSWETRRKWKFNNF